MPTPCDCVKALRNFKNKELYQFYKRAEVTPGGVLGIFGMEIPSKENIEEAREYLKAGLEAYTENCPFEPSRVAVKLEKLLKEPVPEETGLRVEYSRDLLETAEEFTGSAVEGLVANTEGHRKEKGPFSPDKWTRHECTSLLNNVEALKTEIKETVEVEIESFMSPPDVSVEKASKLDEQQGEILEKFLRLCKTEQGTIEEEVDEFQRDKHHHQDDLELFDRWTEEHKEEMSAEQLRDRIANRDVHLWDITEAIDNRQNAVNVFLETCWTGHCEELDWKE